MGTLILNASSIPLNENSGTVPDVSGVLLGWMQKMVFGIVQKANIFGQAQEYQTKIDFQGVWQPLTSRQLMLKPEGERAWTWYMVHSLVNLQLNPDDVITYLGQQYRVKGDSNYKLYGYYYYEMIEDFVVIVPDAPVVTP